jgi:hypothetical protein
MGYLFDELSDKVFPGLFGCGRLLQVRRRDEPLRQGEAVTVHVDALVLGSCGGVGSCVRRGG